MSLRVDPGVRRTVLEHGHEAAPREACGLLVGDDARLTRAVPVENAASDPRRQYELAPADLLAALETVEDEGATHHGFYHTHPRGPRGPSARDRADAAWPGYDYLIADLRDDRVGVWRWTGERFDRVALD